MRTEAEALRLECPRVCEHAAGHTAVAIPAEGAALLYAQRRASRMNLGEMKTSGAFFNQVQIETLLAAAFEDGWKAGVI